MIRQPCGISNALLKLENLSFDLKKNASEASQAYLDIGEAFERLEQQLLILFVFCFFSEYITCTVVLSPTLEMKKQKVPAAEQTVNTCVVLRILLPG